MTNKNTIIKNFSKNAHHYDEHSKIQVECAGELFGMLPEKTFSNILEVGCGTGIFTKLLSQKYPEAAITAMDIAGNMLDFAEKKVNKGNVVFIEADGEKMLFDKQFDLITSNASFQWFDDMNTAVSRMSNMLSPRGSMYFSMYGPATFCELQSVLTEYFGESHWLSSSKFMPQERLQRIVEDHFDVLEFQEKLYKAEFSSLLDLLRDIKFSGTSGEGLAGKAYLGKESLKDLERIYIEKFDGIIATHQVFFCGSKKEAR
jgi:malonyl-CoA O-methyltransferase